MHVAARAWTGLLVLALLACTGSPPTRQVPPAQADAVPLDQRPASSAATTAPEAPAALRRIDFVTSTLSASGTPLWLGVDQGIFRSYGLDVTVQGLSPAAATPAIQGGSAPLGATAGVTIAAVASGATELVFIGGVSNKILAQLFAQPEVRSVADLRGRAAGSTSPGATLSLTLIEALRRYGLDPNQDVSILYLREQPGVLAGLIGGQAAAGLLALPFSRQARDQGYRLLFDTADMDIDMLGQAITTTRDVLEREPDLARRFLMGYVDAIQFGRQHRAATVDTIMRLGDSDDREIAEETYTAYRAAWTPWVLASAIQPVLDNSDVPAIRALRPEQLIDDSILRELERSGWLAEHLTPP
jgi:NitT/TauT family transport system substrate-binding protein